MKPSFLSIKWSCRPTQAAITPWQTTALKVSSESQRPADPGIQRHPPMLRSSNPVFSRERFRDLPQPRDRFRIAQDPGIARH